jgi:hypothetical protein
VGPGAEDGAPSFWLWRQLTPEILPDPAGDRFALLAALRDTLAADRGCLLVDDVHWADEPSLLALRGLPRDPECRGSVCCATRRAGEAGPGWERVGPDLRSGTDVEHIPLHGLEEEAIADVLWAAAGRDRDPGELSMAVRASGGNPSRTFGGVVYRLTGPPQDRPVDRMALLGRPRARDLRLRRDDAGDHRSGGPPAAASLAAPVVWEILWTLIGVSVLTWVTVQCASFVAVLALGCAIPHRAVVRRTLPE